VSLTTPQPSFCPALRKVATSSGEIDEAAAVSATALARSEAFGETLNVPKLPRIRGEVWLLITSADPVAAARAFQLSMQQAKAQLALSHELRSTMGLARL
jgi:predicted ATPase